MTHILTTFIGRFQRNQGGYPVKDYCFPDGSVHQTAFLGYPLARWLGVDHLVILGTSGSMWDHLFEVDVSVQGLEEERLTLVEAVDKKCVQQDQLDSLASHLGEALGCGVTLRLIPTAMEKAEQLELLNILSGVTSGAERLSMDVTHGFRHLPMLALTAALYLRGIQRNLSIEGFWYGALAPEEGQAEVRNLLGLLEISDWIAAWQRFESGDDYAAIAPLLQNEEPELADWLRQAAFHESIHQGKKARKKLERVRKRLQKSPLQGPGALFQPALLERTAWVDNSKLHQRQREQAFAALERKDYLRTCLYGFEAFITKLAQEQGLDPDRFEDRNAAKELFEKRRQGKQWEEYRRLRDLRNVLAHGDRPGRGDIQQAVDGPSQLEETLRQSLNALLLGGD